jgi:Protein kinase domain/AAA ATPase domain
MEAAHDAPQRTMARSTRYRIEAELARGGMGVVYRAWDTAQHRMLAFKRPLVEPTPNGTGSLRDARSLEQEYRALVALKHPRIIEVYDYGFDSDGPYYTMELLDGEDLRARCPLPWRVACGYVRDVASSLALLHARRLVHRDVSPANIRITAEGRAKLLDFGALVPFGRHPQIAGTPICVAPEVLDVLELDGRVDLFALGATAYFALSGRAPYSARSLKQLRSAWANEKPLPPSHFVPEIPPALDALVLSLLALDPLERPASAGELIDRLEAVAELEHDDDLRLAKSYLRNPKLVGRDEPCARIIARIEQVLAGAGGAVLIEGSVGQGKSAMLAELQREARLRGALVVVVNARVSVGRFSTCRALREQVSFELGEVSRMSFRERSSQRMPSVVSAGAVLGDPFVNELNLLMALSRERPVVLAVDDAEHADGDSLAVLTQLAKQAKRAPLLLALSADADGADGQVGLRSLRRSAMRVRVGPLGIGELEQLVKSTFGEATGQKRLCAWLLEQTAGNTLLCMDALTELIELGSIRYGQGSWVLPQEFPRSEKASNARVLEKRLSALTPAAHALASCISVQRGALGVGACVALGQQVLALSEEQIEATLHELVAERVLVSDTEQYAFVHGHLRGLLYQRLDAALRRRAHACVGEQLAALGPTSASEKVQLGCHFQLAGDARSAAKFLGEQSIGEQLDELIRAVPDLLLLLEDSRGRGTREDAQLRYTTPLVLAGLYVDPALHDRFGERTASLLERRAGMNVARALYPWTGSLIAVLTGILCAYVWWLCTPKRLRWYRFIYPLAYFGVCASLNNQATLRLDRETHRRSLQRLASTKGLPPTTAARFVYECAEATRRYLSGHYGELADAAGRLQDALVRVRDMDEGSRSQYANALHFWSGRMALLGFGPEALERAALMAGSKASSDWIMAEFLRFAYHLGRGESALAEAAREALDVLAGRYGSSWSADLLSALEYPSYQLSVDVVGLRRSVQQLEQLVLAHPSLELHLSVARAMLDGHCGQPRRAASRYAAMEEQLAPFSSPVWSQAQGHWVECMNALGEHEAALQRAEHALAQIGRARETVAAAYQQLEREQASALSGLGRHQQAAALLDGLIARHGHHDHPLLIGLLHRDRARVAASANDAPSFAQHLAEARKRFVATGNPALLAQVRRLSELADSTFSAELLGGLLGAQRTETSALHRLLAVMPTDGLRDQRILEQAMALAGASRARLYRLDRGEPVLSAQRGDDAWSALLEGEVRDLVAMRTEDGMTTEVDAAALSSQLGQSHRLVALGTQSGDREVLHAVLVLGDAQRLAELTVERIQLLASALRTERAASA